LKNSISDPYLSGDLFAKNSDLAVTEQRLKNLDLLRSDLTSAKVIFCQSHLLERFLSVCGEAIRAKVLICGNSDFDFMQEPTNIPQSIEICLFQNLNFRHEKYQVLPIGIENLSLAVNGFPSFFTKKRGDSIKLERLLIGPFSPTHSERNGSIDLHKSLQCSDYFHDRLPPEEYHNLISRYRFVLCPRGNGIDTHRFWETVYHGGIPVVNESEWSRNIKNLGIPILEINKMSHFENQLQISVANGTQINPNQIKELWWPYWKEKIKSFI
jgi:hypothetical protein